MHEVRERPSMVERAMLIGITLPEEQASKTRNLLDELHELVSTLGIEIKHERVATVRKPNAKLLTGVGKATELVKEAQRHDCDVIVFDNELTPAQQRNWEQIAGGKILVIDRQEVILDIFGKNGKVRASIFLSI